MEQEGNTKPFQASHRWGNPVPATNLPHRSSWWHAHIAFQRSCLKLLLRHNPTIRAGASQTLFPNCLMCVIVFPIYTHHSSRQSILPAPQWPQQYANFATPKRLNLKIMACLKIPKSLGCFTATSYDFQSAMSSTRKCLLLLTLLFDVLLPCM